MTAHDVFTRKITDRLADMLREAGISTVKASEEADVPLGVLQRNLAGETPIVVSDLSRLTHLLGIKVSELVASVEADK